MSWHYLLVERISSAHVPEYVQGKTEINQDTGNKIEKDLGLK